MSHALVLILHDHIQNLDEPPKNYDRHNWCSQMVVNLLTDRCVYCDVLMHLERLLICQLFFVSTITYIKFKSALSIDECDRCHHGVYDLGLCCLIQREYIPAS